VSRWNDSIILLSSPASYQDEAGAWHEGTRVATEVFCNPRTLGLTQAASVVDLGLRVSAQVQVRACDYDGQDQARYHGQELEVTYVSGGGEYRYLTLARKVGDDIEIDVNEGAGDGI
jgi:hypothetical protein